MNIFHVDIVWAVRKWVQKNLMWNPRKPRPVKNPDDVVAIIRGSDLFKDVPEENIRAMVGDMESVRRFVNEAIIREGDEGDYYYLLMEGQAVVTRRGEKGTEVHVADLESGSVFGEEALISYSRRNATVRMKTDGVLTRLPKSSFVEHVQNALVTWLSAAQAQKAISTGGKWLDVREKDESRHDHLHGALSIPLAELREQLRSLDKDTPYVCYCSNGRQSATAAFLLKQRGFNASVLRGGLNRLKKS